LVRQSARLTSHRRPACLQARCQCVKRGGISDLEAEIAFTIGKVFLYDVSELDRGYRIVSFIVLGALLLAISFAYQRDWLRLSARKNPEEGSGTV